MVVALLIVQDQIRALNLLQPLASAQFKNSTCDLTVGEIFPLGEDMGTVSTDVSEFWLQPSHMVMVLTSQKLILPDNITGLATLVTSLTKEGILCLNAGVIDPGYSGHLSATLVNFSKQPYKIHLNQRLFRVLLFQHAPIKQHQFEPFVQDQDGYRRDLLCKSRSQFAETFLDVKGVLEVARKRAWSIVFSQIGAGWLAFLISLVALAFSAGDFFGLSK